MKKIGRYEIVEELGRGAMGVVYKASDPTIGRMVAIKVLLVDDKPEDGGPSARDIFLREARAAGRLSHPGIVTIHDALEDPETNSSYIVMEYIPGKTLEKILISTPRMDTETAFDIIRQMAEALDYAHRNQIIHRDLKPANIILTEDGRAKITDFGIAKIAAQGAMRTVAIMGTPSYMSPEQVTGGEIDARADIFSMGILLYLMLAGEKPFAGDTAAVMFKIVYEDPLLPSKVNPQLTTADDYVILRCLAKDRARRYSSAREFLDDLEDLRQGRPPRSQAKVPPSEIQAAERTVAAVHPLFTAPSVPATPPPTIPTPAAAPPFQAPVPAVSPPSASVAAPGASRKKSALPIVGVAAAVLAVGLMAGGIWISRRSSTQPVPPTTSPGAAPGSTETATAPPRAVAPSAEAVAQKAETKRPAATALADGTRALTATKPASGRQATLYCQFELEEATLLLLSGKNPFYQGRLIGKKKRGFMGIGGRGFSGILSESVTIPDNTKEVIVRVYSADGTVNVLNKIPATPPSEDATTLRITPTKQQLKVEWAKTGTPGK